MMQSIAARAAWRSIVTIGAVLLTLPHVAVAECESRVARQAALDAVLTRDSLADLARDRLSCGSGHEPASVAQMRRFGSKSTPNAADYCLTVLVRLGRAGMLTPIKATSGQTTSAIALDTGFAAGFGTTKPDLAALPTIAVLKPIAERCLGEAEWNVKLCYAIGYSAGARTAAGEIIRAD